MSSLRDVIARTLTRPVRRRKGREYTHKALLRLESLEQREVPAGADPTVALSFAPNPFIGQQNVPVTVSFTNPSAAGATNPGYGPWVYVILPTEGVPDAEPPDGVAYVAGSARYLGGARHGERVHRDRHGQRHRAGLRQERQRHPAGAHRAQRQRHGGVLPVPARQLRGSTSRTPRSRSTPTSATWPT